MSVKSRPYHHQTDFQRVGDFLVEHYLPENRDGNFPLPAWQYMHYHPYLDVKTRDKMAVWEDSGQIVGVVHHESVFGEAFFEIHPGYPQLKSQMLEYAEKRLYGKSPDQQKYIHAYICDFDKDFEEQAKKRGYILNTEERTRRPMTQWAIPAPFPEIKVAAGFKLISLADENDLARISRVFWRGFNHGDEPPETDIAGRRLMQSAPGYRKDLNIVAVAPNGNYVSYAGLWFEAKNKYAYVEPVCTDPDYRLKGLGKAAVMEGIRRCAALGATVAYVGSTLPIYQSIGFKRIYTCNCWVKHLD